MIEVRDLKKVFGSVGKKVAVDGVSFSVEKGEVLGFLGPNGAGKSTTMRMVMGFLPPSEGSVLIGGVPMLERPIEAKKKMGYLPEAAPLYSDMSVVGFLGFCADLRGLRGAARSKAIDKALDICFLQPVRHQSVDTLSKGYRHRTCLAQAILHDPEILIMDEPTDGLDPNQKHEVRNLIREWGRDKAVIFSTHILEEVEEACTRAVVIHQGKLVADGTPAELKAKAPGAGDVRVTYGGAAGDELRGVVEGLQLVRGIEVLESGEGVLDAVVRPEQGKSAEVSAALSALARERGLTLTRLVTDEGRLDLVFRALTSQAA
jgi:ABC-2 type transport system ATP-binding protein